MFSINTLMELRQKYRDEYGWEWRETNDTLNEIVEGLLREGVFVSDEEIVLQMHQYVEGPPD